MLLAWAGMPKTSFRKNSDSPTRINSEGALVTIVDRVSKFTLIKKVDSKQSKVVTEGTIMLLKPYLDKTHTITADNGKEFAGHEKLAEQLETKVYFAHPYASWERGLNENTNGLIRQYFVKGSSFEEIRGEEVEAVLSQKNKCLCKKSTITCFYAISV
ncbi:IS30 family transposase [Bathymodiolus platifrons methanotrophic gill symbiont]|uniref:IS30 family transposase n=1 Tax=Bathymodiolus platifrons methanotrophic gill symbiont TaxID=113268 RepID=UPI003B847C9B